MPDTPSITTVKSFSYRGQPEEFSNTYHFSGTVPTDDASWKTLADAVIAAERPIVDNSVTFVRAYGYVAGNDNSVAQIDYSIAPNVVLAGTLAGGTVKLSGDVAATIRWYTGATSSRGKKIYCRKYWHSVAPMDTVNIDKLNLAQKTAMTTYAAKMIDGTLPGGFKYCGPQGAVLSAPEVSQWLTTRTLKRRGKRPPTLP